VHDTGWEPALLLKHGLDGVTPLSRSAVRFVDAVMEFDSRLDKRLWSSENWDSKETRVDVLCSRFDIFEDAVI
jgi:hypothetical protein